MGQRHRLRHSGEINRVRAEGESRRHPLAILVYLANGRPESRFAFSASGRVGKAHRRNRAKRLLREVVRLHLGAISPGWDCLLIARVETPLVPFVAVEEAVLQLFRRAGLLHAAPVERNRAAEPESPARTS